MYPNCIIKCTMSSDTYTQLNLNLNLITTDFGVIIKYRLGKLRNDLMRLIWTPGTCYINSIWLHLHCIEGMDMKVYHTKAYIIIDHICAIFFHHFLLNYVNERRFRLHVEDMTQCIVPSALGNSAVYYIWQPGYMRHISRIINATE